MPVVNLDPNKYFAYNQAGTTAPTTNTAYSTGGAYTGQYSPNLWSMFMQAQKAQEDANRANQERYEEGLRRLQEREAMASEYGSAAMAEARRQFANLGTQANQKMVDRGLTGTTIAPSVQAGIARQGEQTAAKIGEDAMRYRTDLIGDTVGFMERRDDVGPDLGMLGNLMMQYGQSGGGAIKVDAPKKKWIWDDVLAKRQDMIDGGAMKRGFGGGGPRGGGGYNPYNISYTKAMRNQNKINPRPGIAEQMQINNPYNQLRAWGWQGGM